MDSNVAGSTSAPTVNSGDQRAVRDLQEGLRGRS